VSIYVSNGFQNKRRLFRYTVLPGGAGEGDAVCFMWNKRFRLFREIAKSDYWGISCLSVRMEQLGSQWTDFHEI